MGRRRSDFAMRLIAVFKLVKAAGLIAIGVGALSMRHVDHDSWLRSWIQALSADPHGKYLTELLAKVTSLHARELREIGVAMMIYAAVFIVEGIGLLGKRAWAEIMTVIVTTSFIPLEVYELIAHRSWAKLAVTLFNLFVVVYLLRRLKREGHWPFHRSTGGLPAPSAPA
jgi:uncharacterized membrane protein (DUF2068 family)